MRKVCQTISRKHIRRKQQIEKIQIEKTTYIENNRHLNKRKLPLKTQNTIAKSKHSNSLRQTFFIYFKNVSSDFFHREHS